jgi:nitric oxide reductase subunit B
MWTVFSVLFLIAGIALLGWHYAVNHSKEERHRRRCRADPLAGDRRHAVDEGHRQVLLGGDGAVPGADPAGRDHRALPGRGPDFYGFALSESCPTR